MTVRDTLIAALRAWADRHDGEIAPEVPEQMADAYRAEVLTEAAEVAAAWNSDCQNCAVELDVAHELRRLAAAGKDTRDGGQPPAGESTHPAPGPDVHSLVHTALAELARLLPRHTVRLFTDRVVNAVAPLVPYQRVWDPALPPGGYVCSICGEPVESEPCREHAPAEGPVSCRRCADTAGPFDPATGLCEGCLPGGAQ